MKDDVSFMSKVYNVRIEKKSIIPAVTLMEQVDFKLSMKKLIQFFKLINKFYQITDIPIILNTSFNENEPMVCSPDEALNCFLRTNMDLEFRKFFT